MPIHVFLLDLTHTGMKIANEGFPYGIGCLAAYLEAHIPDVQCHLYKFLDDVDSDFPKYSPQLVGFSNYIWNFRLHLEVARRIKLHSANTVTVFGGPNFPRDDAEQELFLKACPAIDFYVEGEGERAFAGLVRTLMAQVFDIEEVKKLRCPSVRSLVSGKLATSPLLPRIESLDEIPSPYLAGKLDSFFDRNLMPMIQINRGCPFTCAYCVEGHGYHSYVAKRADFDRLSRELEYIAARSTGNNLLNIADSNFGMYEEDVAAASALRKTIQTHNYPAYIHVATGKNCKERVLQVAELLKGRLRLSGSVQTLDPEVLRNIGRQNISADQLVDLALAANSIGANSYSEVILGLPGDTSQKYVDTMRKLISAGFNVVLSYTLMLLAGSKLATQEQRSRWKIATRYRVLPRSFGVYTLFGERFLSAELEEVCISTSSLSFDDYVNCRLYMLTTLLFYNDKIFQELLNILTLTGINWSDWITYVHESKSRFPDKLKNIYQEFEMDTRNELFPAAEALEKHLRQPGNMDRYISGELGFNVIYTYRGIALSEAMKEINDVAFQTATEMISRLSPEFTAVHEHLMGQLRRFSQLRKERLFDSDDKTREEFDYDFSPLVSESFTGSRIPARETRPIRYTFYRDAEQTELLDKQVHLYGSDRSGLSKIMSRIPVNKIYRKFKLS